MTEYEKKSLEVLNQILEKLDAINENVSSNWYLRHIDTYTQNSQDSLQEISKDLKEVLKSVKK